MAVRERHLFWDGCLNVRDLGGHPTADGDETRFGAVVRADSVRQLSAAGWAELVGYGISTIVDLRMTSELLEDPEGESPVTVVHIPFLEEDAEALEEVERVSRAAPDPPSATRDVYMVFLERFRSNVAAAIAAVANAPQGGVVVHCAGGKDRTGLVTALLLSLAGVSREDIAADYALSEERLRERHDEWIAQAENEEERDRLRRIAVTPAESMLGVLGELERRYGGVEEYLKAGGATDEDLERARARLRA